jgi:hypothetical protein
MGWPLSHHLQQQGKLHFHGPKKIPQPMMIWNGDLTSMPTYYELDKNQKLLKIPKKISLPHNLLPHFILKGWSSTSN